MDLIRGYKNGGKNIIESLTYQKSLVCIEFKNQHVFLTLSLNKGIHLHQLS